MHYLLPKLLRSGRTAPSVLNVAIKQRVLSKRIQPNLGYTFMSRNKQSRKYLIGRSYKNDEFAWPFDLVTITESKTRIW